MKRFATNKAVVATPLTTQEMTGLRAVQLDLLQAFEEVCTRNSLTWFVIAGTALGAVRHGGFIPWDDDIDIGMPRGEYQKLITNHTGEFSSQYFAQTRLSDNNFASPMMKLQRRGTRFVEATSATVDVEKGIFIDIFPLDRMPHSRFARKLHGSILSLLSRAARVRAGYVVRIPTARWAIASLEVTRLLLRPIPTSWLTDLHERTLRLFETGNGPLTIASGTYGYARDQFQPVWLETLTRVRFEEFMVPVFGDVDAYLTHLYGDYMSLPPEDQQRSPHAPIELVLAKEE